MKTAIAVLTSLFLMVAAGCESSKGGGMSGGEGFKISTPTFHTTIKQGETQNVTISLNREEFFKRDVTLEMKASKGISVEPTQVVVKGSDKPEVQLKVAAAKDADLGTYKIWLKGTPDSGQTAQTEMTVKVVAP